MAPVPWHYNEQVWWQVRLLARLFEDHCQRQPARRDRGPDMVMDATDDLVISEEYSILSCGGGAS